MKFRVEIERETDGRWIAEVPELPGVLAYVSSEAEAQAKVQALALRVPTVFYRGLDSLTTCSRFTTERNSVHESSLVSPSTPTCVPRICSGWER
jgi:hypothetical protein